MPTDHCDRCGHAITDAEIVSVNGGGEAELCVHCEKEDLPDADTDPDLPRPDTRL